MEFELVKHDFLPHYFHTRCPGHSLTKQLLALNKQRNESFQSTRSIKDVQPELVRWLRLGAAPRRRRSPSRRGTRQLMGQVCLLYLLYKLICSYPTSSCALASYCPPLFL